ncbi:MAG: hypothetical protein ABIZ91_10400, partial [Gemmatimonadaceae bacterium]
MASVDSLLAISTESTLGAVTFAVEAEAWRSYQPIRGDAGDPMIIVLRLQARDDVGVPGDVGIETVYLIRGEELIVTEAREEQPREARARSVEFVVRNGPLWSPGDSLDVVVTLK